MIVTETVTYLEITNPTQQNLVDLSAYRATEKPIQIIQIKKPSPQLNRYFYVAVGREWYWVDRLPWTIEDWQKFLAQPGHETWMGLVEGTPIGYFEIHRSKPTEIEIVSFGLLPEFVGQGYGPLLLRSAIQRACELQPTRLWLHTSSLDHPKALANYVNNGFRITHRESFQKELPDQPPPVW